MIVKELKNYRFEWYENEKKLYIGKKPMLEPEGGTLDLTKSAIFSLARFIIRIAQAEGRRKRVKRT